MHVKPILETNGAWKEEDMLKHSWVDIANVCWSYDRVTKSENIYKEKKEDTMPNTLYICIGVVHEHRKFLSSLVHLNM